MTLVLAIALTAIIVVLNARMGEQQRPAQVLTGVADRILLEPQAMRVFVRIEKLDRGPGALGVEIVRARDGAQQGVGVLEQIVVGPYVPAGFAAAFDGASAVPEANRGS